MAHALGNPFELVTVLEFCKKYDLWLIEDNCDALGCTYTLPLEKAKELGLDHLIKIAEKELHPIIRIHASMEEAEFGTFRKLANLRGKKMVKIKVPVQNFGGQPSELTCEGGERGFIQDMVKQSRQFMNSCFWFTTLVSKQSNLKAVQEALVTAAAAEVKTIPLGTGNKTARIVAWTFLSKAQQKAWRELRFV
jgi:hypothetical protein